MYVGGAGDRPLCGRHETREKLPLGPDGRGRLIQGGNNIKEWRQEEQSVQVVPWSWHYTLFLLKRHKCFIPSRAGSEDETLDFNSGTVPDTMMRL